MSGSFKNILMATLTGAVLTGQVSAADCMNQRVVQADQIRYLQSSLMVAALQCKRMPEIKARYNDFVSTNKDQLQQSYNLLDGWLQGVGGQDIGKHLTSQANRISAKTWKARNFCGKMNTIAEKASGSFDLSVFVVDLPVAYQPATYGSGCGTRTLTAQKRSD